MTGSSLAVAAKTVVLTLILSGLAQPVGAMPIVEFLFNEGAGSTALNSGTLGTSTNGLLFGPTYSTNTPSGSGFSLEFNGPDFVLVHNTFNYGGQFTVEAWINPTEASGFIWDHYGPPGVRLQIDGDEGQGLLYFTVSTEQHPAAGALVEGGAISPGMWQHVAGVYDGTAIRVFLNGVQMGSFPTTGLVIDDPILEGSACQAVGNCPALGSLHTMLDPLFLYQGLMDDFRIHDTALGPEGLAGGGVFAPIPEPSSVLLLGVGCLGLAGLARKRARARV